MPTAGSTLATRAASQGSSPGGRQPVRCGRPRRSRSRRASPSCVADEVCVRTDSRSRVRRFVKALALGQKIVHFREASTLPAQSEARSSLSAFVLGERRDRGVARRSSRRCRPIGENSDYQTSTPSPRRIRARRILTKRRRGAGAVLFAARRGAAMASRPLRAATAASTTSRCSQRKGGRAVFQIGALRRGSAGACACCSVSKALGQPLRAACLRTRRWAPTKSSAVEDH